MTERTDHSYDESETMSESETPTPGPRRRGCLSFSAALLGLALLLLAGFGLTWWQGSLPRWFTLQAMNRALTAHIELGTVAIDKTVRIDSLRLSQPEHLGTAPSTVYLEGLEVSYFPFPADGRYVDHVAVDLLQLQADTDLEPPTHQWLLDFLAQPGSGSMAFMPKTLQINVLDGGYKADQFLLGVRDLSVSGAFPGTGRRSFDFSSDSLQLIEQVMGLYGESPLADQENAAQTYTGAGSGRIAIVDRSIDAEGAITIPETLELAGSASFSSTPEGLIGRVNLDRLLLAQPIWGEVASSWLPMPLAFEQVLLDTFAASGGIYNDAFEIEEASFEGSSKSFRLGAEDTPYLLGDLQLNGEGSSAAGRAAFQGTASLHDAPTIAIDFAGVPAEWQAGFRTDAWSRAQLDEHLPALTPLLDALPTLSLLDGDFKLMHRDQRNDFTLRTAGDAAAHALRLEATGTLGGDDALVSGDGELRYRDGAAAGPFSFRTIQNFSADLQVNNLNPAHWLAGLLGNEALAALDAPASGQATLQADGDAIAFDTQLRLDRLHYGGKTYHEGPDAAFEASGAYHTETAHATGTRIRLGLGDMIDGALQNWRAETATSRLQGNVELSADLAAVAPLFELEGLWGDIRATGPARVDGAGLHFEAALASEGFGYGDWATPYNVPINATTTIEITTDGTIRMTPVALQLGEELRTEAASITIAQSDSGATLDLSALDMEGSLRTLVVLGLFAAAEGKSTIQAPQLRYADESWQGNFSVTLDASELMLPGDVAKLTDTSLSGTFAYNKGLDGAGRLNIGLLNAGGVDLSDFGSDVRAEGNYLHFDALNTDLFYGRVEGHGRVEVLHPLFPFRLEVAATDLDLARFTESFEPPDTELTGMVSGDIMIDLNLEGLQDLLVDLEAPEGITLNRSAVELILLSQQVGEFTAGGTLSKVVQRVIGEAPQRPFESASLQLGFEEGRITGVALLKSAALNLTVDIKADPGAIAEALRIRTRQ